jgi:superfamily II DNA or RNA helicase
MSENSETRDGEVQRLRRLVKELLQKQDQMAKEILELRKRLDPGWQASSGTTSIAPDHVSEASADAYTRSAPARLEEAKPQGPSDVRLFGSLFRGREDVFARMWRSSKGRSGYSPACANEWAEGLCRKPRVRCADCEHRDFVAITEQVLLDHLLGKHVIGVYPLLPTGECCFLAVDFDGTGWEEDSAAFAATCRQHDLFVSTERSRSGNGGHVWMFFEDAVGASQARRLGSFMLTETMSRRYEIPMRTYDRFFPNQDVLPTGGFGNLIALPLQKESIEAKNTLFLDQDFQPIGDQWAYLRSLRRIKRHEVDDVLSAAQTTGTAMGAYSRFAVADEKPWLAVPSQRFKTPPLEGPLPETVKVVLGNQVYVEKAGLSPGLLDRIRRLATFPNPEFYKKQNLRLSTALTPRMICCAEDFPAHVAIPRGCLGELEFLLKEKRIELQVSDERVSGEPIPYRFIGELTPEQRVAVRELLEHENGVLVAPPGSGKTIVGIDLIAERAVNTLILVHRRPLMEQWIKRMSEFLDIPIDSIGFVGGERGGPGGLVDIAMLQSLVRKGEVKDLVTAYGMVIVDECHHIPAVSFERVLREAKSRYVYGLTATPERRDGHHPIILMQCGPVRSAYGGRKHALSFSGVSRRLIVRETSFSLPAHDSELPIQEVFSTVVSDPERNRLIVDDLVRCVQSGRSPILLTERRNHLLTIAEMLEGQIENLVILHGQLTPKQRRLAMEQLSATPPGSQRALVATGKFIGEGFDDPRLDTLFLTMPISFRGNIIQYAGRLQRSYPGKEEIQIYDYLDSNVAVLRRMFEKRLAGYRSIGYDVRD